MRTPLRRISEQQRYGEALLLLVLAYILGAINVNWVQRLSDLIFMGLLLVLTLYRDVSRGLRLAAVVTVSLSFLITVAHVAVVGATSAGINAISNTIVIVVAIFAVAERLLGQHSVELSTVMGAILLYALLGFAFGYLYQAISAFDGNTFFTQGPGNPGDFVYFSFVVLTTLGFGDLTPSHPLGQRLVVMEALFGQVFLVVLVSRLVSLWKPSEAKETD